MTDVENPPTLQIDDSGTRMSVRLDPATLVAKARKLIELLDDMEKYHGGLVGTATYRGRDELRMELSKWPK